MTRSSRLAVAAFIAAFALLALLLAGQIPSRHVKGDPGPQALPIAVAALVLIGAAAAMIGERRPSSSGTEPWQQALGVGAGTVAFLLLLPVVGFVVSAALFLIGTSLYLDSRRRIGPATRLLTGVGFPLALWWIFSRLLDVSLPRGLMGF
ncbi:MAG: tripartite tricarboxylate transporter TctB family protein [bacterium]|nr:tripartite tricarboxylate transporter TctB family protein [bacterium]